MNPDDASNFDDAASAIAGALWSMYIRLRAEGASMIEAAVIAGAYFATMSINPTQEGGEDANSNS